MTKPRAIHLTGKRIGRLTVKAEGALIRVGADRHERSWSCLCDCGVEKVIRQIQLTGKKPTLSCGCLHAEAVRAKGIRRHDRHLYFTWSGMKTRCLNPNSDSFKYYGGAGVTVCERWKNDFEAFQSDIGPRPSPLHTLDRVDPFGNYEPGNVRWATKAEQRANQRRSTSQVSA